MSIPSGTDRPRVLVAEPEGFSNAALQHLRAVADVELKQWPSDGLSRALNEFDVMWFRLGFRLDAETLQQASRCVLLATPVTGLDHIDEDACRRAGIRIISLRGEVEFLRDVRGTAELTIALLLALLRKIPSAANDVLEGNWNRDAFRGNELFGKTAGVVGLGRLGTIVAGYFLAFGMRVISYDPTAPVAPGVEPVPDLRSLVALSDVVSVHAGYDDTTQHLVNDRVLQAAKPGAVLVNTARGALVDDRALLSALEDGRLAGAALDVIEGEPMIGVSHPLVQYARVHSNLLLVPHIGGNTFESFEKTEMFLAERVVAALQHMPLRSNLGVS